MHANGSGEETSSFPLFLCLGDWSCKDKVLALSEAEITSYSHISATARYLKIIVRSAKKNMMRNKQTRLTVAAGLSLFVAAMLLPSAFASAPQISSAPIRLSGTSNTTTFYSFNWAGYGVNATPGSVSMVKGSWVEPKDVGPKCSKTGINAASFWVGIDGLTDGEVEQTGTTVTCQLGIDYYYAWYEFYPAATVVISSINLHPGDKMSAEVSYASGKFTVSISDLTTKQSFTKVVRDPTAIRSSAEWIAEAPSFEIGEAKQTNYGVVHFTGSSATINGKTGNAGSFGKTLDKLDQIDFPVGPIKASTSALHSDGTAFSVTWKGYGPYA